MSIEIIIDNAVNTVSTVTRGRKLRSKSLVEWTFMKRLAIPLIKFLKDKKSMGKFRIPLTR